MGVFRQNVTIAFVALVAIFVVAQSALADTIVVRRGANVRSQPSTSAQLLNHAERGDRFGLLDDGAQSNGYYHIDIGGGRTGWIYSVRVTRQAGASPASTSANAVDRIAVHYINVGQGAAALVEFPCAAIMIDAGGESEATDDALLSYLQTFFARRTDLHDRIATVFISHTHKDHNRALQRVAETYEIGGYVHNGVLTGSGAPKANWMVSHHNASGAPLALRPVSDAEVTGANRRGLSDNVIDAVDCPRVDPRIRVLSARLDENPGWSDGEFENGNNQSLVIRIDYGAAAFLFTGDQEEPAIETMVDYYRGTDALDVDVWEVGHHGSHNGVTASLLNAMSPEVAVISMGSPANHAQWTAYAYGHPRRGAVEMIDRAIQRLREPAANQQVGDAVKSFSVYRVQHALYATGWDGNITVSAGADGVINIDRGH